jgi:hypothetical protein
MKPKLLAALRSVLDAEGDLADEYRKVGERHAADHDVFHVGHTLARQCEAHAGRIRDVVRQATGEELPDAAHESPLHGLAAALRRGTSAATGRTDKTGPLLLRDLRRLYVLASDCEIAWTIVGQGAEAARDQEVVALFGECCEEIVGQVRWIKTKVKLAAPQVVAVG